MHASVPISMLIQIWLHQSSIYASASMSRHHRSLSTASSRADLSVCSRFSTFAMAWACLCKRMESGSEACRFCSLEMFQILDEGGGVDYMRQTRLQPICSYNRSTGITGF